MTTEEPYEEKVRKYTLDELLEIRENINRDLFPDRYALVVGEIKERAARGGGRKGKRPLAERLGGKIGFVRKAYFCLAVFALIRLAAGFLSWDFPGDREARIFMEGTVSGTFFILIYFGLRYKCGWVVPAILFFSSISAASTLVSFGKSADRLLAYFLTAGIDAAMIFFYLYQIRLFTDKTVTSSFGEQGKILF